MAWHKSHEIDRHCESCTHHFDVVAGVVALDELLALKDRVVHLIGSEASAGCEEKSAVVGPLERLVALKNLSMRVSLCFEVMQKQKKGDTQHSPGNRSAVRTKPTSATENHERAASRETKVVGFDEARSSDAPTLPFATTRPMASGSFE